MSKVKELLINMEQDALKMDEDHQGDRDAALADFLDKYPNNQHVFYNALAQIDEEEQNTKAYHSGVIKMYQKLKRRSGTRPATNTNSATHDRAVNQIEVHKKLLKTATEEIVPEAWDPNRKLTKFERWGRKTRNFLKTRDDDIIARHKAGHSAEKIAVDKKIHPAIVGAIIGSTLKEAKTPRAITTSGDNFDFTTRRAHDRRQKALAKKYSTYKPTKILMGLMSKHVGKDIKEAVWPKYDVKKVGGGEVRSTTIPKDKMHEYGQSVVDGAAKAAKFLSANRRAHYDKKYGPKGPKLSSPRNAESLTVAPHNNFPR